LLSSAAASSDYRMYTCEKCVKYVCEWRQSALCGSIALFMQPTTTERCDLLHRC
jgi:hypothetical protein